MNEIKKIVLVGPESTGKTTLAKQLALDFNTNYTIEMARNFLEKTKGKYNFEDIETIAKLQLEEENKKIKLSNKLLFCDTNLLVLKVWSEYKYNKCGSFILNQLAKENGNVYLLCYPDFEWEYDALRENPNENERLEIYSIFKAELIAMNKNFVILKGANEKRLAEASRFVSTIIF